MGGLSWPGTSGAAGGPLGKAAGGAGACELGVEPIAQNGRHAGRGAKKKKKNAPSGFYVANKMSEITLTGLRKWISKWVGFSFRKGNTKGMNEVRLNVLAGCFFRMRLVPQISTFNTMIGVIAI
jgi:hypothetical protein